MKISFLGAGAIGAMFGGLLKRASPQLDVLLVARGDHLKAMQSSGGIELIGPWGKSQVPVRSTGAAEEISGSHIVFVTVKSQDTPALMAEVAPVLGNAIVVSIQNGINDPEFLKWVPAERLVMGMTSTNMALQGPGCVSMQLDGANLFGAPAGAPAHDAARRACGLFDKVQVPGLTFLTSENVLGVRYNKLTINALGYASCLSASNFINEALGCDQWRNGVGEPIVRECRRVYERAGVHLQTMPGRSDLSRVERLMRLLGTPILGPTIRWAVHGRFEKTPIVFSLLQDLKRRKATEVDYINGEVVRLAKSIGMSAPVNAEVVRMVHELEQRPDASFFSREEVIQRIQGVRDDSSAPSVPTKEIGQ